SNHPKSPQSFRGRRSLECLPDKRGPCRLCRHEFVPFFSSAKLQRLSILPSAFLKSQMLEAPLCNANCHFANTQVRFSPGRGEHLALINHPSQRTTAMLAASFKVRVSPIP